MYSYTDVLNKTKIDNPTVYYIEKVQHYNC